MTGRQDFALTLDKNPSASGGVSLNGIQYRHGLPLGTQKPGSCFLCRKGHGGQREEILLFFKRNLLSVLIFTTSESIT